jgi:UDP-glucuronate 4-epimerase
MEKVLITGTAGFIGHHLSLLLHSLGYKVVGLDEINDYYDINLKYERLKIQGIDHREIKYGNIVRSDIDFIQLKLEDDTALLELFSEEKFDFVINLAAQAGVRYSIDNPKAYINSNLIGFANVLEACRHYPVKHLVYASSSSVYGLNANLPFKTDSCTDHPMALYGATKKANEIMAHSYSHLYNVPTTGLRFFTVYGPMGRPDMALFLFADAIIKNETIKVFGQGKMIRDFTYVGDIVKSIGKLLPKPPERDDTVDLKKLTTNMSSAPYSIYNIGNNSPVGLMDYIGALEKALEKEAIKEYLPVQQGDVIATYADVEDLYAYIGFKPETTIQQGIDKFIDWYTTYYNIE